jgi:formylglycine-generating enzyme required for sulfatase activity
VQGMIGETRHVVRRRRQPAYFGLGAGEAGRWSLYLLAPVHAPKRVIRGGSFLCNVDYCLSYRPSARRGNDPYNPMSHVGFRLVMSNNQEPSKGKSP